MWLPNLNIRLLNNALSHFMFVYPSHKQDYPLKQNRQIEIRSLSISNWVCKLCFVHVNCIINIIIEEIITMQYIIEQSLRKNKIESNRIESKGKTMAKVKSNFCLISMLQFSNEK